jgi:hypothetical protein
MRDLDELTHQALAIDGVESAAIFVTRPGSSELELRAAAGIAGPALDGLVAAVKNPVHPIARALTDEGPTYDVKPMNPVGPALRSHLPLDGRGVLAVSHEASLSPDARRSLERLAASATQAIGGA